MATLAIMVGGGLAAFERAQPILKALGRTIAHFGPTGSGQAAKATNQIMCAGIIEAVAEAMAFAHAQGLPLDKLIDTLGKGAGSSWYFVHRAPNMARGAYPAGFRVRLHAKDLGICHDMAARFGVALPVVERMLGEYAELIARGYGDEDISATYRLKAELFERTNIMSAPPARPDMNNERAARQLVLPAGSLHLARHARGRADRRADGLRADVSRAEPRRSISGPTWRAPRCSCCGSGWPARRCCARCARGWRGSP